jgi:hypothetical protein
MLMNNSRKLGARFCSKFDRKGILRLRESADFFRKSVMTSLTGLYISKNVQERRDEDYRSIDVNS